VIAAVILAAGQTLVPPPAPPRPPSVDTAAFEQEGARYADDLRRVCLSEPGVQIVLRAWRAGRQAGLASVAPQQAAERELGEAAYANPIDPDRIARAQAEKRRLNDMALAASDSVGVAILRQLSPADRRIYVRRMTIMRPELPPQRCEAPAR